MGLDQVSAHYIDGRFDIILQNQWNISFFQNLVRMHWHAFFECRRYGHYYGVQAVSIAACVRLEHTLLDQARVPVHSIMGNLIE